ncbi:MAG: SDR family oxidoreductase, partial [Halanaerobiales bacterium]|nr:SDR family oxidoreductase [Halanaerobiales bacterium]
MRLDGKVAIVTGASRGIGLGIVERFAEEGARVYAGSSSNPSGVYPQGVVGVELNVTEPGHWDRVVSQVLADHGRIDVLVNNAGIIFYEIVHELDLDGWNQVVGVNQTGVWLGMKAVIPTMQKQKSGSIINVASIWGSAAVAGGHVYHATKGAVVMMSKNAAITYVGDGIRVNSLSPGFIDTPLTQNQDPQIN